jgi:hypothetical protein
MGDDMRVLLRNPRRELELAGPLTEGNRHLGYKDVLTAIEAESPGTKHAFYFGYLARASGCDPVPVELVRPGRGRR